MCFAVVLWKTTPAHTCSHGHTVQPMARPSELSNTQQVMFLNSLASVSHCLCYEHRKRGTEDHVGRMTVRLWVFAVLLPEAASLSPFPSLWSQDSSWHKPACDPSAPLAVGKTGGYAEM